MKKSLKILTILFLLLFQTTVFASISRALPNMDFNKSNSTSFIENNTTDNKTINNQKYENPYSLLLPLIITLFIVFMLKIDGVRGSFSSNRSFGMPSSNFRHASKYILHYVYRKLFDNPNNLFKLTYAELLEFQNNKYTYIQIFNSILNNLDISLYQFDKGLSFLKSYNKYYNENEIVSFFCKQIKATYVKDKMFYRVYLSNNFGLNIDTFLLYINNKDVVNIKKDIIDLDDKVFIISKYEYQNKIHKLAKDKTNRIIAPNLEQLNKLIFSNNGQKVLTEILLESLLLKDISPYQINSSVNNESNFFGRVEIIRDIITKENANYLIVGARQLGKSSIIKALERRYESSSKVVCYSFTMDDGDIVLAMSSALGLARDSGLGDVVEAIARADKKAVFLIDEADKFIRNEKEQNYRVTEAFRKLSQEGKATFVLTGFWTLYFAVTSDYHSPLKNFGELIRLEGLDFEACRELMIEPMKRIGVSYEDETVITNVIEMCGRRPNLIAITCNEVLKKLEGKTITQANIDEMVENSSLEDYLKGWGNTSSRTEDNRLDRVIVYLTLKLSSFRLGDVVAMLREQGVEIEASRVKTSLERLVVGYLLQERKKNYSYRVPLFREKLLEDDIEILLEDDIDLLGTHKKYS